MDHELSSPAISTPDKRREVEVPLRTFHPFTQDQVQRLLSDPQLPQDRRTLYAIQLLTGARFNEAVALRWGDCDFASSPLGALQIAPPIKGRAYKHQHPRRVPIHPALHQILADWHSQGWGAVYGRVPTGEDLIIPRPGRPTLVRAAYTERECWYRALRALGLERRPMHQQRHTFVHLSESAGVPATMLEWLVGRVLANKAVDLQGGYSWRSLCDAILLLQWTITGPSEGNDA